MTDKYKEVVEEIAKEVFKERGYGQEDKEVGTDCDLEWDELPSDIVRYNLSRAGDILSIKINGTPLSEIIKEYIEDCKATQEVEDSPKLSKILLAERKFKIISDEAMKAILGNVILRRYKEIVQAQLESCEQQAQNMVEITPEEAGFIMGMLDQIWHKSSISKSLEAKLKWRLVRDKFC